MKISVELQHKRHFVFGNLDFGEIFQPVGTSDLYVRCDSDVGKPAFAALVLNSEQYAKGTLRYFSAGAHVLRALAVVIKLEDTAP